MHNAKPVRTAIVGMFILAILAAASPASAEWRSYRNDRYGVRIDYPAHLFIPGEEPANGDGLAFETPDGSAGFVIFASRNVEGGSLTEIRDYVLSTADYSRLTYSPRGNSWFVLSGFDGDDIYYEKYAISCGGRVVNAFSIRFPTVEKPTYAPVIERMEDSFGSGGRNCP